MNTHVHKHLSGLFVVLIGFCSLLQPVQAQQPQSIFGDGFDYSGWNSGAMKMSNVWSAVSGTTPTVVTNGVAPNPATYITLGNGVISANLSRTLTTDWTLSMNILHTTTSRSQKVSLFNAAGTQGYGLVWNSSTGGNGLVNIVKYNVTAPLLYNTAGTSLTTAVNSGHGITNAPFALIQLMWESDTHTLTLYVDGVQKGSVVDTAYASFSKIFVAGNTSGWFDNASVTTPGGALVPFVTYEAEAATKSAGVTTTALTSANLVSTGTSDVPMVEASGRAYASLTASGQSLTFNVVKAANTIVVRHRVPYVSPYNTKAGPGASLHLYVNSEASPRTIAQVVLTATGEALTGNNYLALSSYHNQTNKAYWEETRAWIGGASLNPGDTVKLKVDAGDAGIPYDIDCIDLELVGAALAQPANTLSVLTYGALGNGVNDDKAAIQSCINAAQTMGKNVWIPPGMFNISGQLTLPGGVKVFGAGMWYSEIYGTVVSSTCPGFALNNTGSEVHDLYIDSAVSTSRANSGGKFSGATPNFWVIENVWMTHSSLFCWMDSANNGLVKGCRVRFTYADGIHLDTRCATNTIVNCHVRGAGDDGIAVLSDTKYTNGPSHDNIVIYNTVIANWFGGNLDLAGGFNNLIAYNYFADSGMSGSLIINMPAAFPMYNTTGARIEGNTIVRGGGNTGGQKRGAIWLLAGTGSPTNSPIITGVTFNGNYLTNSLWRGVHYGNVTGPQTTSVSYSNTTISGTMDPAGVGFLIGIGAKGAGAFNNNTVSVPGNAYTNYSTATFTGSGSGNIPTFSFP